MRLHREQNKSLSRLLSVARSRVAVGRGLRCSVSLRRDINQLCGACGRGSFCADRGRGGAVIAYVVIFDTVCIRTATQLTRTRTRQ